MAGVTSICCPWVSMRISISLVRLYCRDTSIARNRGETVKTKLNEAAPVLRGRNVHRFAVLGHGAPGHRDAVALQRPGQARVRQGLARVFGGDQAPDHGLDRGTGRLAPAAGVDARGEERP